MSWAPVDPLGVMRKRHKVVLSCMCDDIAVSGLKGNHIDISNDAPEVHAQSATSARGCLMIAHTLGNLCSNAWMTTPLPMLSNPQRTAH